MTGSVFVDVLRQDLSYGIRMLRKTPGFTTVALITLAAAIGVNTAVFSVVNALLLKSLPYPEPHRLATIQTSARSTRGDSRDMSVDGATYLAVRDSARSIDVAAQGSGGWGGGVNLLARGYTATVIQARVTAGYFHVLGVAPILGREFSADEDRAGGSPVAVLSHDLWARVFSARSRHRGQLDPALGRVVHRRWRDAARLHDCHARRSVDAAAAVAHGRR